MKLFLIGYRGTGKTTVAAALSNRLHRPWVDVDAEIERRAGRSIREIFSQDGEAAFRDWESKVLADSIALGATIISVGGGGVLRAENRAAMQAAGLAVWLQAAPETIFGRISADPTTSGRRPNLTAQGGLAEIEALLAQRAPLYAACANASIDTEGKSPEQIADEILAALPPGCWK